MFWQDLKHGMVGPWHCLVPQLVRLFPKIFPGNTPGVWLRVTGVSRHMPGGLGVFLVVEVLLISTALGFLCFP